MKISELKKQIKDIPDDTEVFIRWCINLCGNIIEAKKAEKSTRLVSSESHVIALLLSRIYS